MKKLPTPTLPAIPYGTNTLVACFRCGHIGRVHWARNDSCMRCLCRKYRRPEAEVQAELAYPGGGLSKPK